MKVVYFPKRILLASSTLLCAVPSVALERLFIQFEYNPLLVWSCLIALGLSVFLILSLVFAKKYAYHLTLLVTTLWIGLTLEIAYHMRHPQLFFFSLGILAFFSLSLAWIRYECSRSFFDPQLKWYQGMPRAIPRLKCYLSAGEQTWSFRVSRIDAFGVFLFADLSTFRSSGVSEQDRMEFLSQLEQTPRVKLIFQFQKEQVQCTGRLVTLLGRTLGMGLQFCENCPDVRQDLGQFLEGLYEGGYLEATHKAAPALLG